MVYDGDWGLVGNTGSEGPEGYMARLASNREDFIFMLNYQGTCCCKRFLKANIYLVNFCPL